MRSSQPPSRPLAAALLLLLSALVAPTYARGATAQGPALPRLGDRAASRVAATEHYAFYSDFWLNLHDFLYWRAQRGGPADAGADCIATLPDGERMAWERADAHYRAGMGERNPRTDALMRSIRFDIADLPSEEPTPAARAEIYDLLHGAAPAYAACFWKAHDARNRQWIAGVVALLKAHEAAAIARLEHLYQDPWPETVPVDMVGYSNWSGANTTGQPMHMLLSSVDPDNLGPGSLEIVLHEASHGVLGGGFGTVTEALDAALRPHGLDAGRDIWHAVLFYTSGSVARDILRASGYPDYEMYMKRNGVYEELHPALDAAWAPYVEGRIDLQTAARRFAEAVAGGLQDQVGAQPSPPR